jgi:hypothetical protein
MVIRPLSFCALRLRHVTDNNSFYDVVSVIEGESEIRIFTVRITAIRFADFVPWVTDCDALRRRCVGPDGRNRDNHFIEEERRRVLAATGIAEDRLRAWEQRPRGDTRNPPAR